MNELDKIKQVLRQNKSSLKKNFKIKLLGIFGSYVRGKQKKNSDVDILVEFNGPTTFDQYISLKIFLEDLLNCPVDLVARKGIRPQLAPFIEREALRVA